MDVRLLGPVELWDGDRQVPVGPPQRRCVLAVLAMSPGQPVPAEVLIDRVWGDAVPQDARSALYTNLSRLRGVLARVGGTVRRANGGYVLPAGEDEIDLGRFRRLVADARALTDRRPGEAARAITYLRAGEALWRGAPLADLRSEWAERVRLALSQERLAVTVERFDLELRIGRHTGAIGPLTELHAEHPLAEAVAGLLMRAHYAAGQQPDALAVYTGIRQRLVDTLGVEPGPALRELHQQILRGQRTWADLPEPGRGTRSGDVPAQLPPDVSAFSGRDRQLQWLDGLRRDSTAPVVIAAIEGSAGVGKTALAIHWAHRTAEDFPDGQLYVDLRGYAPGEPLSPIDVLVRFLRALGLAPEGIPPGLAETTALYRSQLADRRMLVVLDNAASPEQVRPLLPGKGGSMVLVTSRDQLTGLVARDGAHRLTLDVLRPDEARVLLTRTLDTGRVRAEPEAVAELADLCGHLPLALRIAAANLTAHPQRSIAAHVAQLRDHDRLAELALPGDLEAGVSAAFDHSYTKLPEPAQRLFRLLGLTPGVDVTAESVAALAGVGAAPARELLERLATAHLVQEHVSGRYLLHDLLRRYAADRADQAETSGARDAARRRLYEHYLSRTDAAARSAYPGVVRLPRPAGAEPAGGDFENAAAARRWLDAERDNLVAAVRDARPELQPWAWRIADNLRGYFWLRVDVAVWPATAQAALAAARRHRDRQAEAAARLSLAVFRTRCGGGDPIREAEHALARARAAGWGEGQGVALHTLGSAHRQAGRLDAAADCFRQALAHLEPIGAPATVAAVLSNLTVVYCLSGRLAEAAVHARRALSLSLDSGSSNGAAVNRQTLGEIARWRGQLDEAGEHLTRARQSFEAVGNTDGESICLGNLAAVHRDAGRYEPAREIASAAVALVRDRGDGSAEAGCRTILASILLRMGKDHDALGECRRALAVARRAAAGHGEIEALIGLATGHRLRGELDQAGDHARRALDLARQARFRLLEAEALAAVATIALAAGEDERAQRYGEQALAVQHEIGHRLGEARMHLVLGHLRGRDPDAARQHRERAHAGFTDLGVPEADETAALGLAQHSSSPVQPWS